MMKRETVIYAIINIDNNVITQTQIITQTMYDNNELVWGSNTTTPKQQWFMALCLKCEAVRNREEDAYKGQIWTQHLDILLCWQSVIGSWDTNI